MSNLLKAEFYKLFHSWYFWGIGLFNLLLSSVLLLDSVGETSNLFFASIYNMPILYFLTIIFSALFVGNDFGRRTLQSYINAGHRRGKILFAKLVVHQIGCMVILSFPLLLHSIIGTFDLEEATAEEQHEDKELIKFFVQCFDRPAFQDRIYQEGRMEDFDRAIEDTIIALNTGVLRTRDGSILKKADGKSSVVNIEWREKLNTICDMLVALRKRLKIPLLSKFGSHSAKTGYLTVAVIYGCIFTACHFFCFAKTKEAVITPEKEKISVKVQLKAVMQNRPYLLALVGQILFGFTLYGRNADILYYFTYVEGNASYYTTYSMCIIIPSIIGAACFQPVFRKLNNKGRTASLFALFTGISMLSMFFFNAKESPAIFYALSGLTQFFFSGFNTAIYAIIPDCVEYGEWKTGLRNDGFQYAFISLGNKIGMAVGTALLAGLLGKYGYIANQTQNATVLSIMKHAFTTIPGALFKIASACIFM